MNKQALYLTIINTLFGLGITLFLKDNAVVAWLIISMIVVTIIFIERSWLNEHLFRNRLIVKYGSYTALGAAFLIGLYVTTEPMRKTSAIVASTTAYLTSVKSGDYPSAYAQLSHTSRQEYPLPDFTADHGNGVSKLHDFTIEQVTFNKFDPNKASAVISSPFKIYGQETLTLELVREYSEWRIALSRKKVATDKPVLPPPKVKKKGGVISNFFNALF